MSEQWKNFCRDVVELRFVPCHRLPERSIHIKGKPFPICARCMAILLGYGFIIPLFFLPFRWPLYVGVLLNIPMVVDGYTQRKGWRKSNNALRISTGLLSGFGMSMLVVSLSKILIEFFSKL
jgi:uncharacterized membrane protein